MKRFDGTRRLRNHHAVDGARERTRIEGRSPFETQISWADRLDVLTIIVTIWKYRPRWPVADAGSLDQIESDTRHFTVTHRSARSTADLEAVMLCSNALWAGRVSRHQSSAP